MDSCRKFCSPFSGRRYRSIEAGTAEDRTLTKVQKKWIEECSIDSWTLMLWRPVFAKVATYTEVAEQWSIKTLLDCIEQLDYQYDLEKEHYDNLQKE